MKSLPIVSGTIVSGTIVSGTILASLVVAPHVTAATVNNLYVFGDSLSDTGNAFAATGGTIPPSPPYFEGRFSNGPIWIDYLAQDLRISVTPVAAIAPGSPPPGSINFAVGGATTGAVNAFTPSAFPPAPPGLATEVELAATLPANPEALYIVWAGANDYLPTISQFVPFNQPDTPVRQLSLAIQALYQQGARNFLVPNLPPLGQIPSGLSTGATNAERLNRLSLEHNALLATTLDDLEESLSDSNFFLLDIESLFAELTAGGLGFTNLTTPCLNSLTGTVCNNPNEFLFWDENHPTTVAHRAVATLALETLQSSTQEVPEPGLGLVLLGLGVLGSKPLRRNRRSHVTLPER